MHIQYDFQTLASLKQSSEFSFLRYNYVNYNHFFFMEKVRINLLFLIKLNKRFYQNKKTIRNAILDHYDTVCTNMVFLRNSSFERIRMCLELYI